MIERWFLVATAVVALVGGLVWGRAAYVRYRTVRKIDASATDLLQIAGGAISHDLHTAGLYLAVALAVGLVALTKDATGWYFIGIASGQRLT